MLPPPFSLQWGDSPKRIMEWASSAGLDHTVLSPARNPQLKIHKVSSPGGTLPDHEASILEARFTEGELFEVTLHYVYPGKPADVARGKFTLLKRLLTDRHGAFRLGAKETSKTGGVVTLSTSYRLDRPGGSSLELVLTEITDPQRGDSEALFSVMYHNSAILNRVSPRIVIRRDGVELPEEPLEATPDELPLPLPK